MSLKKQNNIDENDDFYLHWLEIKVNIPIKKLDLNIRQYNCLKRVGINNSEELYGYDADKL